MQDPLPFRQAFALFLRNARRYSPPEADFGRKLGIGESAAFFCMLFGFSIAGALTVALAWVLARPLIDFSLPLFIVALVVFFIAAHGTLSYVAYRAWHRHCYPEA